MNQTIDNDIVATKEFHQRVSSLYKLGGRNRNIFAKVQSLLGGIKEEGEKAFNQFSVTNHGESRIKSCVKYDLGQGFRVGHGKTRSYYLDALRRRPQKILTSGLLETRDGRPLEQVMAA